MADGMAHQLAPGITISDLRARRDFVDRVAHRIWQAWWQRDGVAQAEIAARLRENLIDDDLPIALVAHRGDDFLGTASLIPSDLAERSHHTPWVAAVWTEPAARRQSVASALIARACDEAVRLGHAETYLCAAPALRGFYQRRGWRVIEENVGPRGLTVFVREAGSAI